MLGEELATDLRPRSSALIDPAAGDGAGAGAAAAATGPAAGAGAAAAATGPAAGAAAGTAAVRDDVLSPRSSSLDTGAAAAAAFRTGAGELAAFSIMRS